VNRKGRSLRRNKHNAQEALSSSIPDVFQGCPIHHALDDAEIVVSIELKEFGSLPDNSLAENGRVVPFDDFSARLNEILIDQFLRSGYLFLWFHGFLPVFGGMRATSIHPVAQWFRRWISAPRAFALR
jgi:hypothetical protein